MSDRCIKSRGQDGLTIVELMVVLAIMSIVAGAAYSIFASLSRSYTTQNVTAKSQLGLRIGVDTIVRDIRMAGLDPLNSADAGIVMATPTAIQFTSDKNLDGDVDDPAEDITYELNGDAVLFTDNQGAATLMDHVTDFSFTYYDSAGSITTIVENIRSVQISLATSVPAGRAAPVTRQYSTRISCRNIGL